MAQEELWTGFSGKGLYAKLAEHARKDSDGNPIVDTYARKDELPGSFIVSASVSGRTLTLTPDTGNPIEFSDTGDVNTIESISIGGTSISPSNKDVAIPLGTALAYGVIKLTDDPDSQAEHTAVTPAALQAAIADFGGFEEVGLTGQGYPKVATPSTKVIYLTKEGNAPYVMWIYKEPAGGDPYWQVITGDGVQSVKINGTELAKDAAGAVNVPLASATESGGVTAYVAGAMSGEDKGKLDSARSFSRVKVVESESPEVSANLDAAVLNDTLELVAGDNVSLEATLPNRVRISSDAALEKSVYGTYVADEQGHAVTDEQGNLIYSENSVELYDTFKGTKFGAARAVADRLGNEIDETYATKDAATTSSAGLMSAEDKTKLDGITDYVVSASVSGGTLTLTPKNGEAVTFTGDTNVIEGVKVGNDALVPDGNKVVTVPLFDGSTNGAVNAPASANRNSASFLSGMGDWSMLEEVSEQAIDDIFMEGIYIGGRKYRIVTIGNQQWTAENLDYTWEGLTVRHDSRIETQAASYYNNDKSTYGISGTYKCGLLYNWTAANYLNTNRATLLPEGWHVPSDAEFGTLITYIGGSSGTASKLKARPESITDEWPLETWTGTDDYGFNAVPTGDLNSTGQTPAVAFNDFNNRAFFWTVDSGTSHYAYDMIYNGNNIGRAGWSIYMEFSIRLVKDVT